MTQPGIDPSTDQIVKWYQGYLAQKSAQPLPTATATSVPFNPAAGPANMTPSLPPIAPRMNPGDYILKQGIVSYGNDQYGDALLLFKQAKDAGAQDPNLPLYIDRVKNIIKGLKAKGVAANMPKPEATPSLSMPQPGSNKGFDIFPPSNPRRPTVVPWGTKPWEQ